MLMQTEKLWEEDVLEKDLESNHFALNVGGRGIWIHKYIKHRYSGVTFNNI